MEKEHWKTKVVGIQAKNIFELAEMITDINLENFVIATQPIKVNDGYDALVFIKMPPEENVNQVLRLPLAIKVQEEVKKPFVKAFTNSDKPTEKQLKFLKEHKFRIEPNLTKQEAYRKISEYLSRQNQKPRKEENYGTDDY